MKITCLIENTSSRPDIVAEHGLSLYVETATDKILFDFGQTDAFAKNAEVLGIDLSEVNIAVLSHGHYDHGGGINRFLELNKVAKIYMQPTAKEPHFHSEDRFIGLNLAEEQKGRFIEIGDVFAINDNVYLLSCNNSERICDIDNADLLKKHEEKFTPDNFDHEHYMLIKEGNTQVLISGCSHKGILNIAEWFSPDVLVGGFHLSGKEPGDELSRIAKRLEEKKTLFYTCHCTGQKQFEFMQSHMKNLRYISGGESIEI